MLRTTDLRQALEHTFNSLGLKLDAQGGGRGGVSSWSSVLGPRSLVRGPPSTVTPKPTKEGCSRARARLTRCLRPLRRLDVTRKDPLSCGLRNHANPRERKRSNSSYVHVRLCRSFHVRLCHSSLARGGKRRCSANAPPTEETLLLSWSEISVLRNKAWGICRLNSEFGKAATIKQLILVNAAASDQEIIFGLGFTGSHTRIVHPTGCHLLKPCLLYTSDAADEHRDV